jgi:hypothetical protein
MKIILLLSAAVVLISCSKVGKDEYIISGTAKGVENGKTIILETRRIWNDSCCRYCKSRKW